MVARLILGQRGAGEFGLWVSKPGIDAFTASGDNLLFGPSNYYSVPYMKGTVTQLTIVTHNLGYIPFCTGGSVSTTTLQITGTPQKPVSYVIYRQRAA